jgi:hypothetical protein
VGITAVLTDLIAVRLRSTALAGLPLLVLFTVPVTMNAPHSQLTTVLVFCLSGSGLPGHAQRGRAGADPCLGPPGLAVALGAAVRRAPAAPSRYRLDGFRRHRLRRADRRARGKDV